MSDKLAQGVMELVLAEIEVDRIEALLAAAKKVVLDLERHKLPAIFDDAGEVETTLPDGTKAKKSMRIEGSLPRPDDKETPAQQAAKVELRAKALAWASAAGWDPFIKCKIVTEFDRGDAEKARELAAQLQRDNNSAVVTMTEDIHHSTLKAQARIRILQGKDIPLETLGLTALTAVKITQRPK